MISDILKQLFPALGRFIAHHLQRPFHRGHESGKVVWLPEHGLADPLKFPKFSVPVFWHTSDPERVKQLIAELLPLLGAGYYCGDNLLTWSRSISFVDDPGFRRAYEDNIQNPSDAAIAWRRYILACAGYHCVQLEGDFVECGVYRGTGIKTLVDYLGGKSFPKHFYGYDTFDYNPVPGHEFEGQEAGLYESVRQRFDGYPQVHLIRGLIPDSFEDACPNKISYLHIDLNNAESEIATLGALFDRVVPGGIIILDDYEWAGYRPQKIAEDSWLERRKHHVFPLPTGQGLVIKRG
jgi:O-methyltransferase